MCPTAQEIGAFRDILLAIRPRSFVRWTEQFDGCNLGSTATPKPHASPEQKSFENRATNRPALSTDSCQEMVMASQRPVGLAYFSGFRFLRKCFPKKRYFSRKNRRASGGISHKITTGLYALLEGRQ